MIPEHHLFGHRAAVNAVALAGTHILSASGDRSVRLWDAQTGALLHALENHHTRGIAAIDVALPFILTGSSDKHVRLLDITACTGWMTAPDAEDTLPSPIAAPATARVPSAPVPAEGPSVIETLTKCGVCGAEKPARPPATGSGPNSGNTERRSRARREPRTHLDLVRSVRLGEDFAVSASYDCSLKVWDRRTGEVIADLTGGHTGRVFAVDFDTTKVSAMLDCHSSESCPSPKSQAWGLGGWACKLVVQCNATC
jgi:WD40 repeat protein